LALGIFTHRDHYYHHHVAKRSAVHPAIVICRQNDFSSVSFRASVSHRSPVSRQIVLLPGAKIIN